MGGLHVTIFPPPGKAVDHGFDRIGLIGLSLEVELLVGLYFCKLAARFLQKHVAEKNAESDILLFNKPICRVCISADISFYSASFQTGRWRDPVLQITRCRRSLVSKLPIFIFF